MVFFTKYIFFYFFVYYLYYVNMINFLIDHIERKICCSSQKIPAVKEILITLSINCMQ